MTRPLSVIGGQGAFRNPSAEYAINYLLGYLL